MACETVTPAFTDGYDEAFAAPGEPRPHYAAALAALDALDVPATQARIALRMARAGVRFGAARFHVDPVPRLITGTEWAELAAGLAQRVRALEAFVADAYGRRRIVEAGIVPAEAIETAEGYEPDLLGCLPPWAPTIGVAGLDVVRGRDGSFQVLEDNLRIPSGVLYAAAARDALDGEPLSLPGAPDFEAAAMTALRATLEAAAPGTVEPAIVVLSDGPGNSAWYEHAGLARRLGVPVVTPGDLRIRGERLVRRDEHGRDHLVDVVYRRCDEDRLRGDDGRPTAVAELLLGPWLAGRLGVVNSYGTGVADDKAIHAHVEDMVRFYLGEEPLLASVPTFDLVDDEDRAAALDRLDELVVKPRFGHGGHGIVVCAHATREDVLAVAQAIRRRPEAYVAQPTVALSRHPTVTDAGTLAPRHVDLRPFAFSRGDAVVVPPGGLTRVALAEGALVVNSSQRGGGKDTRVLA